MRAVRCAVNFNEILQTEAGLEEMWAESRDTVNEKYAFASPKLIRMWLERDGADLQNLGIIPTKQQLPTNRPRDPQRTRYSSFPRASKPNSLDDSWTFTLPPCREAHQKKAQRKQQTVSS